MSTCARNIIEGKTSSAQKSRHHVFKSAILSGAVNLEKHASSALNMQQCLENIHKMKLWKPTGTEAEANGKLESRLCEYATERHLGSPCSIVVEKGLLNQMLFTIS